MRLQPALLRLVLFASAIVVLSGLFSAWIPHPAAGLALTGFEIGEWIKFAPEVRDRAVPIQRAHFYWPPTVAALGLAFGAGCALRSSARRWYDWLPLILAAGVSLLPLPLLEDIQSWAGFRDNLERLLLVAGGLAVTALVAIWRAIPAKVWGLALAGAALAGVLLLSRTFSASEPIVERLYGSLIDPGVGYNLTRGGMLLLALVGTAAAVSRQAK